MSQQQQQPQGMQAQQPGGQMTGGQTTGTQMSGQMEMQMGGGMSTQGLRLQDVQSPQERAALDGIARAMEVCAFCAEQCIMEADPHMLDCIRLCEDVTELGETCLAMLPRNSQYAVPVLQAFQQAAQACAQECGQHSHAHCQDCAQVLQGTTNAVQQFLGATGQQMI